MWKRSIFMVILDIVSMQIHTTVGASLDEGALQDLGGGPVASEAVQNLQTALNFDIAPLVQRSIAALSPFELVDEVERLAESVITQDKSNTNIPYYQTSDPPAYELHTEIKGEPTSMDPDQSETYEVTNTPDPATPESITTIVEDMAPAEQENALGSGSPLLSLFNVDAPDQESPASAISLFDKTLAIERSNFEQSLGSLKESLESLLQQQQTPSLFQDSPSIKPLEETGPAEIVKIKFIKSEFEPFLIPFPKQRFLDLKADDPVPPFLIDMTPVPVPKPRAKSVKKDLGATQAPTEAAIPSENAHTTGSSHQVSTSQPTEESTRANPESAGLLSSDQSKPSEGIQEASGIQFVVSQELKIQEIMPETEPPVEPKPSSEQQTPEDATKDGNSVRPYIGKQQDGAAEMPITYIIKAPEGLEDGPIDLEPFNDARAQVIADA